LPAPNLILGDTEYAHKSERVSLPAKVPGWTWDVASYRTVIYALSLKLIAPFRMPD
jgi:hypothetical protein